MYDEDLNLCERCQQTISQPNNFGKLCPKTYQVMIKFDNNNLLTP